MSGLPGAALLLLLGGGDDASVAPVRPQTARLTGAYELACQNSPAFRSLIASLAAEQVIVFVVSGTCDFGRREACLPHRVTEAGGYRVLQVIVREDMARVRLAGVLAHELQHALEVARAGLTDGSEFDDLFWRIGRPCAQAHAGTCYETDAANEVQSRVVSELGQVAARP